MPHTGRGEDFPTDGKFREANSYLHPCQPTTRSLLQPTVIKRLLCAQYWSRCLGFTSEQNKKCWLWGAEWSRVGARGLGLCPRAGQLLAGSHLSKEV